MATEVAIEEIGSTAAAAAAETEAVPVVLTKEPHKLERKWTFWFDNQSKPKQGAAWGTSLRKVYTFDTVEDFWWYLSNFLCLFTQFIHYYNSSFVSFVNKCNIARLFYFLDPQQ
jgi:hypothetical protein